MLSEDFKTKFKNGSIAVAGLFSGVGLAIILMQYQGSFELRVNAEEGHIKVDGRPRCELPSQVTNE